MAGLQHGVATVSTSGCHTDSLLGNQNGRGFLLAGADDPEEFCQMTVRLSDDRVQRESLGREAMEFYDSQFAWPGIAASLLSALVRTTAAAKTPEVGRAEVRA